MADDKIPNQDYLSSAIWHLPSITAGVRSLRCRRLADHDDLVDVVRDVGPERPVERPPAEMVLVDVGEHLGRGRGPAVGADAVGLDDPVVAAAGPEGIAVAAVGVEQPGLDLA